MLRLDFRIDWGYCYLYSRRHYHPVYVWDGALEVDDGRILECRKLHYPVLIAGPGWCAKETPLNAPRWQSRTRRGLAGVRVVAEVDENAVFTLKTASGEWTFTARQVAADGRIVFSEKDYLNISRVRCFSSRKHGKMKLFCAAGRPDRPLESRPPDPPCGETSKSSRFRLQKRTKGCILLDSLPHGKNGPAFAGSCPETPEKEIPAK